MAVDVISLLPGPTSMAVTTHVQDINFRFELFFQRPERKSFWIALILKGNMLVERWGEMDQTDLQAVNQFFSLLRCSNPPGRHSDHAAQILTYSLPFCEMNAAGVGVSSLQLVSQVYLQKTLTFTHHFFPDISKKTGIRSYLVRIANETNCCWPHLHL